MPEYYTISRQCNILEDKWEFSTFIYTFVFSLLVWGIYSHFLYLTYLQVINAQIIEHTKMMGGGKERRVNQDILELILCNLNIKPYCMNEVIKVWIKFFNTRTQRFFMCKTQ